MKINKKSKTLGLAILLSVSLTDACSAYDGFADTLFLANRITTKDAADQLVLIGNSSTTGSAPAVVIGFAARAKAWGVAIGPLTVADDVGTVIGTAGFATNWGVALGSHTYGSSMGVGIGVWAVGNGLGNVAIGGSSNEASSARVPTNWVDTVELGRGLATLQGGLNFRGRGIVDSNGVLLARALPTDGAAVWDAGGLRATNLFIVGGSASGSPNLGQVLGTGGNGGGSTITNVTICGATLSNVVIYGDGMGLTNVAAAKITGLGSAAFSNAATFASSSHIHSASQISGGQLASAAMLPSGTGGGTWNANGLMVTNLNIQGLNLGTNYLPTAGGTVTNLRVVQSAIIANLIAGGVTLLAVQGDLAMGSFTNAP